MEIEQFVCNSASRLLNTLYEYNSQSKFLKEDAWLISREKLTFLKQEIYEKNRFTKSSILKKIPFSLPFEFRLNILKILIHEEKIINGGSIGIRVRRNNLFEDGFENFKKISAIDFKSKLRVFYIDEYGYEEKGIDGGGIFKEFLNDMCKILFNPGYGLFKITEKDQQLYPNPDSPSFLGGEHCELYLFVGTIIGRAIYDNILIGTVFSPFFLRRMIGKANFLHELESLDPEMYKNLKFLKNYEGSSSDLGLNFTLIDSGNNNKEVELVPNGRNIVVDDSNKFDYIYRVANYKLNEQIKVQTQAFLVGLQRVLPIHFLQIFNEYELQMVLSGTLEFDFDDLKKNVNYIAASPGDKYIKEFWKIVEEMTEKERNMLIKFVTSCERPPLLGFSNLEPRFTIQMVSSEKDTKLPTSSTCFNKLNLPLYSSAKILKQKLLLAISSAGGFHLT